MPVRQRGFTLIEFSIAVVLALALMAALAMLASQGTSSADRATTLQQIVRLDQAIRDHYAGQPSYAGISDSVLITRGVVPPDLITRGTDGSSILRTAGGMPVAVSAQQYVGVGVNEALGASYQIATYGLTSQDCMELARTLQPSAILIYIYNPAIGGTYVQTDRGQTQNASTLASACQSKAYNDLSYITN